MRRRWFTIVLGMMAFFMVSGAWESLFLSRGVANPPAAKALNTVSVARSAPAASISTARPQLVKTAAVVHVTRPRASAPTPDAKAKIYQHLEHRDRSFMLSWPQLKSVQQAEQAFEQAAAVDPYVYWNISRWSVKCTWLKEKDEEKDTVLYSVSYRESKAQSDWVNTRVHQVLRQILKPGMLDFQKEKAIHDWIVEHVQYDRTETNYTAYDALAKGRAVCQGYALLAYRMLSDAGIPTRILTGTANGSHMWNEVELHGHWYQLDVTWDDPLGDRPKDVYYTYFNLTDKQMAKDHHWNRSQGKPAVTDYISELQTLERTDKAHAKVYASLLAAVRSRR
ncbi:MAG: hypothetical protein K6T63_15905 [Alicyclobacillus herbarius]|uniref:transglutaminase domain-containing protein n=1 Tax=Alicyclobacillus herbarius TaxID=122960 RepID=UPI0023579314|nr:transglutaminase domain-containing protein [Alicyclobacillus herbarius]MCL6634095.1 hypothetical protein [Alicyclobacillus herbarius]